MKSLFTTIKTILKNIVVYNQYSSPGNMDSPKAQDTDTMVLSNKNVLPLQGGHSIKMVACVLSNMRSALKIL